MTDTVRKRGRPATIDADLAMQSVIELFRDKGYAATSLDDLSAATGLSRPSLYRAFGDKLNMYIEAMDAFGAQVVREAVPALMAETDLEKALRGFFDAMLTIYFRDEAVAPGCLVFATAPANADEDRIQARLNAGVSGLDQLMRDRIGAVLRADDADILDTAVELASNTLIAFSARAKSGISRQSLSDMGARSAAAIVRLLNG